LKTTIAQARRKTMPRAIKILGSKLVSLSEDIFAFCDWSMDSGILSVDNDCVRTEILPEQNRLKKQKR
jgi:hypothetical protein